MKNLTYVIILATALFASCSNGTPVNEATENAVTATDSVTTDTAMAVYQCPMKCQGDTTYIAPGQCPVCGMDLEKL